MIQKNLPFDAQALLNACHLLPLPALLFNGQSAAPSHQEDAVLAFSPTKSVHSEQLNNLEYLTHSLASNKPHAKPRSRQGNNGFVAGWLGAISYDAGNHYVLGQQNGSNIDRALPALAFHYYPFSVRINVPTNQVTLQNYEPISDETFNTIVAKLQTCVTDASGAVSAKARAWRARWSKAQYTHAFNQVQHYLHEGDAYQVNLAMPFHCVDNLTQCSPMPLLQSFNAPFSAYMKTDSFTLFSVSPERFLSIHNNQIETKPIKGTVPRGRTPVEDQALYDELKYSEKNRSENLMIVDLLRNDLSRSATAGSVRVEKLFDIESFANVHHLVSTVLAQKAEHVSHAQVLIRAFPGGSITGAPKKRAMEIIAELEAEPRGFYCGSFGYFDDSGRADFNILIRSITATPEGAVCWGGGGVIADSTSDNEYEEVFHKIGKLLHSPI